MAQAPVAPALVAQATPGDFAGDGCDHRNNPFGARFCQDCGDRLAG